MPVKVSLKEITDALEVQFDELPNYLDRETGEVHPIHQYVLKLAEDNEPPDDLPEWQQPEYRVAEIIVRKTGRFLALPSRRDVHEWEIMERFARDVEPGAREALLYARRGRGAFGRFNDAIRQHRLEQAW